MSILFYCLATANQMKFLLIISGLIFSSSLFPVRSIAANFSQIVIDGASLSDLDRTSAATGSIATADRALFGGDSFSHMPPLIEYLAAKEMVEEYGFQLKDYAYDYQGQKNVVNIDVLCRYIPNITKPQYPDILAIKKDLEQFMQNYPNKMQYWESLNKEATQMLMDKYLSLAAIRIKFQIAPNAQQPFARTSIVTLTRH
jgi:hypothetical protein